MALLWTVECFLKIADIFPVHCFKEAAPSAHRSKHSVVTSYNSFQCTRYTQLPPHSNGEILVVPVIVILENVFHWTEFSKNYGKRQADHNKNNLTMHLLNDYWNCISNWQRIYISFLNGNVIVSNLIKNSFMSILRGIFWMAVKLNWSQAHVDLNLLFKWKIIFFKIIVRFSRNLHITINHKI